MDTIHWSVVCAINLSPPSRKDADTFQHMRMPQTAPYGSSSETKVSEHSWHLHQYFLVFLNYADRGTSGFLTKQHTGATYVCISSNEHLAPALVWCSDKQHPFCDITSSLLPCFYLFILCSCRHRNIPSSKQCKRSYNSHFQPLLMNALVTRERFTWFAGACFSC